MPTAVLPATRPWPLHDTHASRTLEASAAAALPPHALMARAGRSVARLALALAPHARRVLVLAGPGNNGGDALVAATHLHDAGLAVSVVLLSELDRLPADAAWALTQAQSRAGLIILPTLPTSPTSWQADLVIDGLLGLGLSRAPAGSVADAIAAINHAGLPVLAIDLPSGLDSDRGTTFGGAAVRASHTLALLSLKPGLFTAEGRDHAGRVWFDDLGVAPSTTSLHLAGPPCAAVAPPHAAHKGRFGDLVIIGGDAGMGGAAVLAAHAGLAAGAGRVYLGSLAPDAAAAARPEVMHRPVPALLAPPDLQARTVVAGCGGGEAVRAVLPPLLHHAGRLVLDADALNTVAADASLQVALITRSAAGRPTLMTPHPLEAARLLGTDTAAVQADRVSAARALAVRFNAVVVLKGSGSAVAARDGSVTICPFGNARLSTAGTGDVLAGWLGGLWSRTASAAEGTAALAEIACAGVARHGLAAEQAPGQGPLLAADLIRAMQQVI